jgi:nucleotide-binding universal stress UspA family protein
MSLLGKSTLQEFFKKILIVVDGSAASIRAAKFAIILSKYTEAQLYALAVIDTATIRELELSRIFIEEEGKEYERELEADAQKHLQNIVSLGESKKRPIEAVLEHGSVYAKIVGFAMDKNVDHILIGESSRSKRHDERDRMFLEYTRVLRDAKCSVLFVKNEDIDLEYKKM